MSQRSPLGSGRRGDFVLASRRNKLPLRFAARDALKSQTKFAIGRMRSPTRETRALPRDSRTRIGRLNSELDDEAA
jgi:hypothetical protein